MPVLGNNTKPGFSYFAYGGTGFPNQNAEMLTNTTGAAISVLTLGAWVGGWAGTARCRLFLWSPSTGSVQGSTAEFVVANEGAAGTGNVSQYEVDLTTPVLIPAGITFYVGIARNRNDDFQISTNGTGNPHFEATGGYPSGGLGALDGFPPASVARRTGMYIANYAPAVTSHSSSATLNAIVKKNIAGTGKTLNAIVKKSVSGSATLNAIVKAVPWNFIIPFLEAIIKARISSSATLNAIVRKSASASAMLNAIVKKAGSGSVLLDADARRAGRAIWTTPISGIGMSSVPTLTFLMPAAVGNMFFQIALDTVNTFDSGNLTVYDSSVSQAGWQYWNGSTWTAVPGTGVPNTYSGNEARLTLPNALAPGIWYRRVRAGV